MFLVWRNLFPVNTRFAKFSRTEGTLLIAYNLLRIIKWKSPPYQAGNFLQMYFKILVATTRLTLFCFLWYFLHRWKLRKGLKTYQTHVMSKDPKVYVIFKQLIFRWVFSQSFWSSISDKANLMNTPCWVGMRFHFPGLIFIERNNVDYYRPQGKVMFSQASVSHSVHYWPHGCSVTAHPCYGAVGHASYWNAYSLHES